jgi:hypothetical protein
MFWFHSSGLWNIQNDQPSGAKRPSNSHDNLQRVHAAIFANAKIAA